MKIVLKDKVLEFNEKFQKDSLEILEKTQIDPTDFFKAWKDGLRDEDLERICEYFPKKQKLYLTVEVMDIYQTSLLFQWLQKPSKFDGDSLQVMGCKLLEIGSGKQNGFTDEEKNAIEVLRKMIIG